MSIHIWNILSEMIVAPWFAWFWIIDNKEALLLSLAKKTRNIPVLRHSKLIEDDWWLLERNYFSDYSADYIDMVSFSNSSIKQN